MAPLEVVYVPSAGAVWHSTHTFQAGMTVQDALELSGVFLEYPEAMDHLVGIFSKQVKKTDMLKPGDRVEIYRALLSNPKDKRRTRAKKT
jgi:uncharacterized protein